MKQLGLFEGQLDSFLSYREASEILGISVATLHNWVKAHYISPGTDGANKTQFSNSEIQAFKDRLSNGEIDRLSTRANKRHAKANFIPREHVPSKVAYEKLEEFLSVINQHKLDKHTILLLLSLNLLKAKGLILNSELSKCTDIKDLRFKNDNVKRVIENWASDYGNICLDMYTDILSTSLIFLDDLLGVVYQSLLSEGEKALSGSYYTPTKVVDLIVDQHKGALTEQTLIVDPCCGTGQFLLSFSKYMSNPSNIWGYDLDKLAVHIARVNLLLAFPNSNFFPNIYCQNTLYVEASNKFDIVVTNPPWGFHFSQEDISELTLLYPSIASKEAFSYFLAKGVELLKPDGKLSFVLPEAMIKIRQHSDIRKRILDTNTILSIRHLGNIFTRVLSPAILLSLAKKVDDNNSMTISNKSGQQYQVSQSRFRANTFYTFDTEIANEDSDIIAKIYEREHITLANNADWALGIVTGNNRLYLSQEKEASNEGILKGSDIKQYYFDEPSSFLTFEPSKFQQTAPKWKYRVKEKLIYKFISSSLVFAYDEQQMLTLNSANVLIPQFENYPIKLALALLNSALFQYLYKKKFNTIKVLRGDLEKLPFPLIDAAITDQIIQRTNKLIQREVSEVERAIVQVELNDIIFFVFDINPKEAEYIKSSVKD